MPRERARARQSDRRDPQASRWRVVVTGFVAAIAGMATCAISVQPAYAGTYVMRNCNVPGHNNSPMAPWHLLDPIVTEVTLVDACATGGGVSFMLNDLQQMKFGRNVWIMLKKPDGPRSQIRLVKVALWYAARLASSGHPITFQSWYYRPDYSSYPGVSVLPPGSENLVAEQQLPPDTWYYKVGVHCGPLDGSVQNPVPCNATDRVPLLIRGVEVTLSEDVPPMVLRPGGSLLDPGPQSGLRTVTYSATDAQSGLSRVEVLLDEMVVASQDVTPQCHYADFTVCPPGLTETLHVDTRAVANGSHALTVRVRDAAGNERVVHGERRIDVVNAPSPSAGQTSASAGTSAYTLNAHFKGTNRSTLTVPYGQRVGLVGRLTQGFVPAAPGSQIELVERRDSKGARDEVVGRVKTKADGSFSAGVRTTRPSRTVRLAYRPHDGTRIVSPTLKLRVRAAARLRASLHGRLVRFTGRLLSTPIPRRGKRVLMEGRSPGSAWTRFKSLRTDRKGRFSGSYRLRVHRPGVLLKIRAVVPGEGDYGYVSSRSGAVPLRVR